MKICELAPTCPGCSLWGTPYSDQIFEKVKRLEELFQSHLTSDTIHTHTAGEYELRERFDFIIKENQIGFGALRINGKIVSDGNLAIKINSFLENFLKVFNLSSVLRGGSDIHMIYLRKKI